MKNATNIVSRLKRCEMQIGIEELRGDPNKYSDDVLEAFIVREMQMPLEDALKLLTSPHQ